MEICEKEGYDIIQFTRDNIEEVKAFCEGRAENFRVASSMPYHKYHFNLDGRSIPEGVWLMKDKKGKITISIEKPCLQ